MFTGIVEEMGRVASRGGGRLVIEASLVLEDAAIGSSIAHNGCCLTVAERGEGWYAVDMVPETLGRTNLGDLGSGDPVNLERPVRLTDRLGGHLVQGHVDGTAEVDSVIEDGDARRMWLRTDDALMRFIVEKGSIAIDGVSLTVASVKDDRFEVALIPHTLAVTTLGHAEPGTGVNVEIDVIAKYVERLMQDHVERT